MTHRNRCRPRTAEAGKRVVVAVKRPGTNGNPKELDELPVTKIEVAKTEILANCR